MGSTVVELDRLVRVLGWNGPRFLDRSYPHRAGGLPRTRARAGRALAPGHDHTQLDLRTRVVASACLAAVITAIVMWAECDGVDEPPDLIDQAYGALCREICVADG